MADLSQDTVLVIPAHGSGTRARGDATIMLGSGVALPVRFESAEGLGGGKISFGSPEDFAAGEKLPAGLWLIISPATGVIGDMEIEPGTIVQVSAPGPVVSNGELLLNQPVVAIRIAEMSEPVGGTWDSAGPRWDGAGLRWG